MHDATPLWSVLSSCAIAAGFAWLLAAWASGTFDRPRPDALALAVVKHARFYWDAPRRERRARTLRRAGDRLVKLATREWGGPDESHRDFAFTGNRLELAYLATRAELAGWRTMLLVPFADSRVGCVRVYSRRFTDEGVDALRATHARYEGVSRCYIVSLRTGSPR